MTPRKIVERVKLGEPVSGSEVMIKGIKASDVLESFFRDISPPCLESADVLRKAMVRGIAESVFAYTSGSSPAIGGDGKFQVSRDKVVLGKSITEDEIDFESGFLMVPEAVPQAITIPVPGASGTGTAPPPSSPEIGSLPGQPPGAERPITGAETAARMNRVGLTFNATRDQVFKAFPAIANLADKSDNGLIKIKIEATSSQGYDRSWFRNAVEEPLDEANIKRSEDEKQRDSFYSVRPPEKGINHRYFLSSLVNFCLSLIPCSPFCFSNRVGLFCSHAMTCVLLWRDTFFPAHESL